MIELQLVLVVHSKDDSVRMTLNIKLPFTPYIGLVIQDSGVEVDPDEGPFVVEELTWVPGASLFRSQVERISVDDSDWEYYVKKWITDGWHVAMIDEKGWRDINDAINADLGEYVVQMGEWYHNVDGGELKALQWLDVPMKVVYSPPVSHN